MAVSVDPRPASLEEDQPVAEPTAPTAPTGPGGSPRWRGRRGLLAVLIAVIVLALAALAGAVSQRYDGDPAAAVQPGSGLQGERDQAMRQARAFMLRMNTYGPDDLGKDGKTMPGYRSAVTALVSDKFGADFESKGVPLAEATVAQQRLQRTAEVYSVGIKRLDDDSATALVAGSFTNSYPNPDKGKRGAKARITQDPLPFRVTVDLVEDDDGWLVDSFAPVGEEQQPGSGPGSSGGAPGSGQGGAR